MTNSIHARGARQINHPIDSLRCIACGGPRDKMLMLDVRGIKDADHPSMFIAYVMCLGCDETLCGELALATLKRLVDEAHSPVMH